LSSVIRTERLSKSYGAHRGIVDLEVRQGEVFCFLGPDGAGKTTTMRIVLDLIGPTSGRAEVFGIETTADPVAIHRRVGYLPGEFDLWAGDESNRRLDLVLSTPTARVRWAVASALGVLAAVLVVVVGSAALIGLAVAGQGGAPATPVIGLGVLALYGAAVAGAGLTVGGLIRPDLAAPVAGGHSGRTNGGSAFVATGRFPGGSVPDSRAGGGAKSGTICQLVLGRDIQARHRLFVSSGPSGYLVFISASCSRALSISVGRRPRCRPGSGRR